MISLVKKSIQQYCYQCQKLVGLVGESKTNGGYLQTLDCSHLQGSQRAYLPTLVAKQAPQLNGIHEPVKGNEPTPTRDALWELDSKDGGFYPFQKDGILFFENAFKHVGAAINEDDRGAGKTIQVGGFIRYNPQYGPFLIVVPPPLVYKWQRELKRWVIQNGPKDTSKNPNFNSTWTPIIWNNRHGELDAIQGQNIVIISSGMIGSEVKGGKDTEGNKELLDSILSYGFKTAIFDEAHYYKNDKASRTDAYKDICKMFEHSIHLSGTPIENRLGEYYNMLNAVDPKQWFHKLRLFSYASFGENGQALGLASERRNEFHSLTSEYIIRRMKKEILPFLPAKVIDYPMYSLADNKRFVNSYNKLLDELEEYLNEKHSAAESTLQIIARMSHLRHLVGIYKVPLVAANVARFLEDVPDEKVTIGCYHELVHQQMAQALEAYKPIILFQRSVREKDTLCEEFRTDPSKRVLIASIAADREGRDLQFCPTVYIAERDWNRSREDQFQDRFHRIGSEKFGDNVFYEYTMAKDTIDEYFHEMVYVKGSISDSATEKDFDMPDSQIRDMAKSMVAKRLKYVG